MGDLILDSGWESAIQLSVEGSFFPLDASGEAVEVNEILHNALVIMHVEILKVSLCFALGVMWSKVVS